MQSYRALVDYYRIRAWERTVTKPRINQTSVFLKEVFYSVPWSLIGFLSFLTLFFAGDLVIGTLFGAGQKLTDDEALKQIQQRKVSEAAQWSRGELEKDRRTHKRGFRGEFEEQK